MSFSPKPRALEEGFDAGLGPRHVELRSEDCYSISSLKEVKILDEQAAE